MKRFLLFVSVVLTLAVVGLPFGALAEATAVPEEAADSQEAEVAEGTLDTENPPEGYEDPEIIVTDPVEVEDLQITQGLDSKWINILLLGGDSLSKKGYGRSDAMIVLSINSDTSEIKMTSIMRDIWVNLNGVGGAKINAAVVYGGPEMAMRTVNENFGMNISQYAMVNMTALATVVDKLGGIEVDVTKTEKNYINKYLEGYMLSSADKSKLTEYGENTHLTGNQALAFARNRYQDSDYNRTERQRKVLSAIAKKLQENNVFTIAGVVTSLLEYVKTNLDLPTMVKLAMIGLKADVSNIAQLRLPVNGSFESGMKHGTWSIRPNFETNKQALYDFIYGEAAATEVTEEPAQ